MKKLMTGSLVAAALLAAAPPALARSSVDFYVGFAPPPLRVEYVPAPRVGFVWVPGYWDWRGNRHVWVKGHWEKARPGYRYREPRWEQRDGRWYLERGRWDRNRWEDRRGPRGDRDRDGIPNRVDRDKDNDGVPNRFDSNPNNPRRN